MLKVHPPLLPCLKFSVKTFVLIFVVILGVGTAIRYFNGESFIGFLLLFQLGAFFVGVAVVLGVFFYLIFRVWAWSVEPSGITGRSYWGRRTRIAWNDVGSVGSISVEGIPALVVASAKSKAEVYAYTLGVDIPEIYKHLSRHAGPDHILTQWFRPVVA